MSLTLESFLKELNLKAFKEHYQVVASRCEKDNLSMEAFLYELCQMEVNARQSLKIKRLIKNAKLPRDKYLEDFDFKRIPGLSKTQVAQLATGEFIDRAENLIIFGNPGTGKTHLSIALAREWCLQKRRIKFYSAAELVQELLLAKKKLQVSRLMKRLNGFDVLIIDDISYVPFDKRETDVLFHLLAQRYEMKSILITSNAPFDQWGKIFKDEMTTTAAVDRVIHYSTILELNAPSYRMENYKAKKSTDKIKKQEVN